MGGLAAAGLLFAGPSPAAAQQDAAATGGIRADLRISQRFTQEDDEVTGKTGIGLSVTSETRRSTFGLFLDGDLEQSFEGDTSLDVTDPNLRLSFGHESRSSAVDLSLRYRESDVDTLFEDLTLGPGILVLDDGMRKDLAGSLGLEVGRDAPVGGRLDLGYAEQTYSDTTDPSLIDEATSRAALALRFRIDPRIEASLNASVVDTDRDTPGLDVRSESVGLGLDLDVTKTLETSLYLGQTRIVESGVGPRTVTEGLAYTLSLTETRPNGTLSGSLASDIDEAGRRTTARIDRSLELPTGRLRVGVGVSEGEDDDLRPLLSLAWVRDLPRGSVGLFLDQSFSTDTDGSEALNSRFSLSYRQDLTPVSTLEAALRLGDTDFLSGPSADTRKVEIDLAYRHALTEDWDLLGGYTHTISDETGARRSYSDEIYIGIEKRFQWWF